MPASSASSRRSPGRTDDVTPTITVIDEDEHRRLPQGWKIIAAVVLLLFAYGAYHLLVPAADKMLAPPVAPVPQASTSAPKKVAKVEPPKPQPIAPTVTTVPAGTNPSRRRRPMERRRPPPRRLRSSRLRSRRARVYGQLNKSARVVLRMKQPTSVLVQGADGTTYINRTLNAGDTYMVPDMVGLTLTTANAGAVEIDLDGVAMGAAGKNGQIGETLSLDPQSIADRYNGRQG